MMFRNHIFNIYFIGDLALNNLQWLICQKHQPNQIIYLIYMYTEDLALNKLQWLICHKNPTKPNYIFNVYVYRGFGIK